MLVLVDEKDKGQFVIEEKKKKKEVIEEANHKVELPPDVGEQEKEALDETGEDATEGW